MEAAAIINVDGAVTQSGATDRVPWWSFTKTALAIAALRLVERGALSLDAKLPGQPFSLRQLLRHEAGLPDYGGVARYHSDVATGKTPWPIDGFSPPLPQTVCDMRRERVGPIPISVISRLRN